MQETRLFKIVYHLLDKGQATAPELAEKFEVSVRTIYRDIDALSGAGIPIYCETGRNGGIHLLNDFVLDKAVLSVKEKQEILAALQSLAIVGSTYEKATLEKLSALFQVHTENWYEIDFSRWGYKTWDNEKFEALKSAVIHHRCVKIMYASSYEAESERTIQPLKLMYKSKEWYVKAYCAKKKDFRIFKLNRILKWEILEEEFAFVSYPESQEMLPQTYEQVILRFPKEMAYRVYDEFGEAQIARQENGDFIVSAEMPQDAWFISFLLSLGTQVEIIEPSSAKSVLAKRAKEIYEKNKP